MLKVLVAPLDWGLGHATRCIPIIKELVQQGCTVIIAAGGAQKAILQEEFPELSFVEIPGLGVKYGKNRAFTLLKIIFSIPKILIGIKRENGWLRRFAGQEGVDLVISDNRYGLYGDGIFSVFLTHQLAIRTSLGAVVDGLLRRMNYSYIHRFSICWVPDEEEGGGLAGMLSHPLRMPDCPVRYIGWLSRLEWVEPMPEEAVDLLVLLSGPEPQRSILEGLLLKQLGGSERVVFIRGLPGGGRDVGAPVGVRVVDYLAAKELERVVCQSRLVLARPGYSTVMDLVKLGKKAIYIPTPGQPEQEYLGPFLEERGLGICRRQRGFVFKEALEAARAGVNGGKRPVAPRAGIEGGEGPVMAHAGVGSSEGTERVAGSGGKGLLMAEIGRVLEILRAQSAVGDLG